MCQTPMTPMHFEDMQARGDGKAALLARVFEMILNWPLEGDSEDIEPVGESGAEPSPDIGEHGASWAKSGTLTIK
jgi:hypothetical protein